MPKSASANGATKLLRSAHPRSPPFFAEPGSWEYCFARSPKSLPALDRKSTRLNSSHSQISYAVFCLKKQITLLRLLSNPPRTLTAPGDIDPSTFSDPGQRL